MWKEQRKVNQKVGTGSFYTKKGTKFQVGISKKARKLKNQRNPYEKTEEKQEKLKNPLQNCKD